MIIVYFLATPAENVKKLRDYVRETSEMMIAKEIYDKRIETNTGKINNLEETLYIKIFLYDFIIN